MALQPIVRIRMDHRLKLKLLENYSMNFKIVLSADSIKQALSNNVKFDMVTVLLFEVPPFKLFY